MKKNLGAKSMKYNQEILRYRSKDDKLGEPGTRKMQGKYLPFKTSNEEVVGPDQYFLPETFGNHVKINNARNGPSYSIKHRLEAKSY